MTGEQSVNATIALLSLKCRQRVQLERLPEQDALVKNEEITSISCKTTAPLPLPLVAVNRIAYTSAHHHTTQSVQSPSASIEPDLAVTVVNRRIGWDTVSLA